MKILFVCHRFPYPPDRGGKIRPFNFIRHLQQTHEVTVAAPTRSVAETAAVADLRAHCTKVISAPIGAVASAARMLARLPSSTPLSFAYFRSERLARAIRDEVRTAHYDLALAHCSSAAPYVSSFALSKILDFGDMDSEKWKLYGVERAFPLSLVYRLEARRLRRMEAQLAARFDASTCTTAAELESLRDLGTVPRSACVPNGVDGRYFEPSPEPYEASRICFLGRMDYYPNEECMVRFCRDVLPRIRRQRADVVLDIVGADPSRRVRALGRIPGVTVTGAVADVRPYVRRAALSVAPLAIARGTQNKILESLAMGVPVVCSSMAAGGVDAVPGTHLLTADTPDELAATVVRVMNDPEERRRLALAGRARVVSNHNWENAARKLDEVIAACAGSPCNS